MVDRLVVKLPCELMQALTAHFASWTRNTLKQRLRLGCVRVNEHVVSRHDHALSLGDVVEIVAKALGEAAREHKEALPTLYLDDDLVAIDKPVGLLSVAAEGSSRNALAIVRESLSRPGRPAQLWPVHRLDRETSGVLLFARSREVCEAVQAAWNEVEKVYLAVVEGHPKPPAGLIDAPLWEDAGLRVRVSEHADAKPARTRYRTQRVMGGRSLLEVNLDTGRKHQIRAHLAHLGHAIVGDDRYGRRDARRDTRLGLHSASLHLKDCSGKDLLIVAPPPPLFLALLGSAPHQNSAATRR